ncbi:MBL fold metallo-hydrolase [Candidatus Micrarchaeota archaeon]|nr:MBL fold metallo-hydrolase [Candidatus Micrarchaeota archaeon]
MASLTFYGGAGEIGGNKILLKDLDAKIYLDFGEEFGFGEEYFWEYLQPRAANGLEVYFEFGLVPKVEKLYSKAMLERTPLDYEEPDIDGVIISHAHSDHLGHLPFIDEKIPLYMGHGARRITEIYRKLYPSFYNLGEHENIVDFSSKEKFSIKHLEIEPVHVEHSIPGAYGFIIKTSGGNIVYTGDLRMHGPRADMTREFIERAKEAKPYAMLCEGTRMESESEHNFTEGEVGDKVSQIIKGANGIVFGYFSMSNIDRFMSFYNAARENGRILVVDTRLAYVLNNLKDKISVLPDVLEDENIRVYYRLAKSCTFCEKDYYVWEREFMGRKITYEDIRKNPEKYVMHLNFNKLMELVYLQPKDAHFIYSSSEHFLEGEGNEEEKKRWEAWMGHFGIEFHKAHCSGHASKEDLGEMIKEINPEILIPIHTSKPEEFLKLHKNVRIPKKGETIEL